MGAKQELIERIEAALAEIRPAVQRDGLNVQLLDVGADGTVRLAVVSLALACPVDMFTLRLGVKERLRERVPEVTAVRAVTEGSDEEYTL